MTLGDIPTSLIISIIMTTGGALVSLVVFMTKRLMERIQRLEEHVHDSADRDETREMILDQVKPLKKQMDKIDRKLDKIIDIMINAK